MKYSIVMRYCYKFVVTRPIKVILILLILAYFTAILIIAVNENVGLVEAGIRGLPAFFGELGTPDSRSVTVRIAMLASLFVSMAFLAVITAQITTVFVKFCQQGGRIMSKIKLTNHIIICGWNFQGPRIVEELLRANRDTNIVILVDSDKHPLKGSNKSHRVDFVRGDPTQDEALERACVHASESVIVLTDFTKNANEADAEALMIVLAVESLNRNVHTCVQIINSSNRVHLERAHADEIVCLDQIGGNLLVVSAMNHGMSRVIKELLTFNEGSEFYRHEGTLAKQLAGTEFAEAVRILAQKRMVLLGFETDLSDNLKEKLKSDELHLTEEGNRVLVVNPQAQYILREGDALFLIAESEPGKLKRRRHILKK